MRRVPFGPDDCPINTMKSWSLRIVAALVVLILAAVLTAIVRSAPARVPLPSPNGYDDFIQAGAAVPESNDFADYRQWTVAELAARVEASSNAFALVQAGLQKASRTPGVRPGDELDARMQKLASFKRLAYALAARSQLALLQGHTDEAAALALDGVQMAHGIARGGVLIEALVGMACEAVALRALSATIPNLDSKAARSAARRLADLDRETPTAAETMASEHAFNRSHGLYGTLLAAGDRFGMGPLVAGRQKFETKWASEAARRRELILQLARRAYEVEKGRLPDSDAELVPDVLPSLPVVPADGSAARVHPAPGDALSLPVDPADRGAVSGKSQ